MGPAPVRADASGSALSAQRAVVLESLQGSESMTAPQMSMVLGLHVNTVREHLDALVEQGLATRGSTTPNGRGRPAWRYVAAETRSEPDPRVRDYAGLATALASHIARTSPDPAADAQAAGEEWGRALVSSGGEDIGLPSDIVAANKTHPIGTVPDHNLRQAIVDMLGEFAFDPEVDSDLTTIRLRRCPLLDAARRHPDVVCAAHQGLVRGVLTELGGDPDVASLMPFAEPGACVLKLDGNQE